LFGQDFFESAAILAPAFDDFFHHALGPLGLARADAIAYVHYHVAVFDNADPVVVES
jgi:hypothetical protein